MKDLRKYLTLHMLLTARSVIECAVIVHALVGMGGGRAYCCLPPGVGGGCCYMST